MDLGYSSTLSTTTTTTMAMTIALLSTTTTMMDHDDYDNADDNLVHLLRAHLVLLSDYINPWLDSFVDLVDDDNDAHSSL